MLRNVPRVIELKVLLYGAQRACTSVPLRHEIPGAGTVGPSAGPRTEHTGSPRTAGTQRLFCIFPAATVHSAQWPLEGSGAFPSSQSFQAPLGWSPATQSGPHVHGGR